MIYILIFYSLLDDSFTLFHSLSCWQKKDTTYKYERVSVSEGNRTSRHRKKGFSIVGACKSSCFKQILTLSNDGTLCLLDFQTAQGTPRFCVTGISEGISSTITALASCPQHFFLEDGTANQSKAKSRTSNKNFRLMSCVLIGTINGTVQLLDLQTTQTYGEYSIFQGSPVRGVKWISQYEIMAWVVEE